MIGLREEQDVYLSHFARLERETAGQPSWLRDLRRSAFRRFSALGFPTTRNEDWKYTNVSPIAKAALQPERADGLARRQLDLLPLATFGCSTRLVFVNGRFSVGLSATGQLPSGVKADSLAAALNRHNETLEKHLARYAGFEDHAFVALNTALLEDGALIEIPGGLVLEEPIHLVFVSTQANGVWHPRNLIVAGRRSEATVIESYLSVADSVYFTNVVTEIVVAEGAVVNHCKVQSESEQAFHVATVQGLQDRNSTLNSHNISFGGALTRNDINSVLDAEGAECVLNGLFVASGRQHIDNHTSLDHAQPHCNSREIYKGILDGKGVGVFNGKIKVRKDAQKTNAIQSNKNLLLSEDAVINTKPQLEIHADDVRCTHGATVGQLDQDGLFYMRSRGIERQAARDLLTYAFAADILDRMNWEPLRKRLEEAVYGKLSKGRQGEST